MGAKLLLTGGGCTLNLGLVDALTTVGETASMEQMKSIQEYYGKVLQSKKDLQTSACCAADSYPKHLRDILGMIHPEVEDRFYGCGVPIPHQVEGLKVLDLGSGTGRDCFVLSKLVGPNGSVTGVDMTEEQLAVARKHVDYHMEKFGFSKSNVEFKQGYIEDLEAAGMASESVDLVVSNCVTNLSPDKERLFSEVLRVLKPGGELYFSDVFADRRLPAWMRDDDVLLGECLGGAMYTEDFRRLFAKLGCNDVRMISSRPIAITNPAVEAKLEGAKFYSITLRAFKLEVEDRCEDYGQIAYYKGTIENCPNSFSLDDHHLFEKDRPLAVCSNTATMLQGSRLAPHFKVVGDTRKHFGLFDCSDGAISAGDSAASCC